MKVFGELEKAQLENVTSDGSNDPKGMIKFRSDLNKAKVSNGSTYKKLADEDDLATKQNSLGYTAENAANKSVSAAITTDIASDTKYPTVKGMADWAQQKLGFTAENTANKDNDTALSADSTTRYPTQHAVKAYADTKQPALGFTAENAANKGAANGYAPLDSNQKIPIANIPEGALERLIIVADQAARYALTTATVHEGDTIKQVDTGVLYYIVDQTKLNQAAGYEVYAAGTAAAVAFTGITGKPTTLSGYGITDAEATVNKSTNVATDAASDTKYPSVKAVKTYADTKQAALGYTAENAANKSTDGTLASNSDVYFPTQKAVKTYVDTGLGAKQATIAYTTENVANKDTDNTLAANSDTKYPSQKAIKSYVDTGLGTKQASLGFTAENSANKGAANGYAGLDSNSKIPIANIPAGALERLVVVANQTARYALTTATVHNGDTVKQTDTGILYYIVDETQLSVAAGYEVYAAGTAAAVAWSGITSKPTTLSGFGITDAEAVANKSTSTSLGTSDTLYPTQNAVKSYVDTGLGTKQATIAYTTENVANKSTDGTLASNSTTLYPSQSAVKTYADTKLPSSYLSTDTTLASNSDVLIPSQKAVKAYIDARSTPAEFSAGSSSTAITVNFTNGSVQKVTMTGNCTFTLSNPVVGSMYILKLVQDATGSRTYTWPAAVKWSGGTAPTGSGANKTDLISLYWDGTNYFGSATLNF
jgi:hypothetical protein